MASTIAARTQKTGDESDREENIYLNKKRKREKEKEKEKEKDGVTYGWYYFKG